MERLARQPAAGPFWVMTILEEQRKRQASTYPGSNRCGGTGHHHISQRPGETDGPGRQSLFPGREDESHEQRKNAVLGEWFMRCLLLRLETQHRISVAALRLGFLRRGVGSSSSQATPMGLRVLLHMTFQPGWDSGEQKEAKPPNVHEKSHLDAPYRVSGP